MIAADAPPALVAPAPSSPVILPFAPPRELRYRTEQRRTTAGGRQRFTMDRTLAIAPTATGWRATLTMTGFASDAPVPVRATFEAGMRPFLRVPVTVVLDRDGQRTAVEGGDVAWGRITAALGGVIASLTRRGLPAATIAQVRTIFAGMTDLSPAARDRRLAETIEPLLARTLPPLRPGETTPYAAERAAPVGPRLASTGTLRLATADATTATYEHQLTEDPAALVASAKAAGAAAPTPQMMQRITTIVSRTTGLLVSRRTTTSLTVAGRTSELTEDIAQIR